MFGLRAEVRVRSSARWHVFAAILLAVWLHPAVLMSQAWSSAAIEPESRWSGLWEGERLVLNGSLRARLFLGEQSWIDIDGQCRGRLTPAEVGEWEASFDFEPIRGKCDTPGTLTAELRKYRGGSWSSQGHKRMRFRLKTPSLSFKALVMTPYSEVEDEKYRFVVHDADGRFMWPGAAKRPAEARAAANDQGYRCVSSSNLTLTGEAGARTDFRNQSGRGYLFLLHCDGDCEDVVMDIDSSRDIYVEYYPRKYGTPAVFFEAKSWAWRTHTVDWQFVPDHATGKIKGRSAKVSVAILSNDPLERGRGCERPFR